MRYKFLLLVLFMALSLRLLGQQTETAISGIVELPDGSPANGAVIKFYPYGPSSGIGMKGFTNEKGEFSFSVHYVGLGILSSSKVSEGYPDAVLAFYNIKAYNSTREISPSGKPLNGILLKFSHPNSRIEITIKSLGRPASLIQVTVVSNSKPGVYGQYTFNPGQTWFFVLPMDSATISVSAEGHEQWTYITKPEVPVPDGVLRVVAELKDSFPKAR